MERDDRPGVAHFYSTEPLLSPGALMLGEDAAHHARVRRLAVGAPVTVRDGSGTAASGTLVRMSKSHLELVIERPHCPPPLPPVHLLVPVADKERMLLLAEKATELGVTTWRPVLWRRSRSVAGRGEGTMFAQKVEARMIGALLQSEGAWLPQRFTESNAERAIAALPAEGTRLLLDPEGEPMAGGRPGGSGDDRGRARGGAWSPTRPSDWWQPASAAWRSRGVSFGWKPRRSWPLASSAACWPFPNPGAPVADCLFCRIVRKEIPAQVVAETDDCLAFRDISPQAPTHVLVIPKAHVDSLAGVTDPLAIGRVAMLAADVARTLGVEEAGYRLVFNTGGDGGQTVGHLHGHLLAGRQLHWPPG